MAAVPGPEFGIQTQDHTMEIKTVPCPTCGQGIFIYGPKIRNCIAGSITYTNSLYLSKNTGSVDKSEIVYPKRVSETAVKGFTG